MYAQAVRNYVDKKCQTFSAKSHQLSRSLSERPQMASLSGYYDLENGHFLSHSKVESFSIKTHRHPIITVEHISGFEEKETKKRE